MSYHKLLKKQIESCLSPSIIENKEVEKLLNLINQSYHSFEREKKLADRAFEISEEEYSDVNRRLLHEIEIKKQSVKKLQEAIVDYKPKSEDISDDILLISEYLNLQIQQRKSAELVFTSLVNNLQIGILLETENGSINYINEHFCGLFNIKYKPIELHGKKILKGDKQIKNLFKNPDAFANRVNEIVEAKVLIVEELVELADNRYYSRSYIPIYQDKIYKGHIWSYTEITEKIEAEISLKASEQQFRSLAENVPGILYNYAYYTDGSEAFTYISPDAEKKIGINEEQLKKFYEIIHPADVERELQTSKNSTDLNLPYYFEGRFLVPNKPLLWLRISSKLGYINADGVRIYNGIITNITQEKEAQLALELREEKYRSIISNMNLGLIEVDNDDCIQFTNQSFREMSGYSTLDLIGNKTTDLFIKGENQKIVQNKKKLRHKGISDAYEISVLNKNGEKRWWLVSGAPKYNDNGELDGSVGIHLDITEQKKLESDLILAKEQALESSKAKESFLANMSHEIRTPMNAIMGMSKQLNRTPLVGKQQFYLDSILSASDNLLVIINDILDMSKIEAGKLIIEKIGFNLKDVINKSLQVFSYRAEEKGLEIICKNSFSEFSNVLIGDPYRLNQVLLNLLSNSIKFTEKGTIILECQLLEDNNETQVIEIKVEDTGVGMDEHFLEHNLFRKFSQEYETGSRKYNGTGLGLNICKQLVYLMGGEIDVASKKGEGTSIRFTIPFLKGTIQDLPPKENTIISSELLTGKKILITDDNDMNRLVASILLQNYDVITLEACTGQEAIEMVQSHDIDLVLMDIQMPVMNGFDATKYIRKELKNNLPIIALTANALKGEMQKCLNAGMDDFIPKPYNEEEFIRTIIKQLGKSSNSQNIDIIEEKPKLYDLQKLYDISRNDKAFVKKMVDLFIQQAIMAVDEIKKEFAIANLIRVKDIAHKIKPSIDNMGISSLTLKIREIETLAKENDTENKLSPIINDLDEILKNVISEMQKEFT